MTAARLSPRGLAAATAAFGIWGLFPVYLHPLSGVPALQVIAHRVAWACVFIFGWLLLRGELAGVSATLTNGRLVARLTLTALLISGNWLVYVWSVTHAHIVDTSLGYYINPLVNVVLGVFVLRERLNGAQWTAVALAGAAVAYLAGVARITSGSYLESFILSGLLCIGAALAVLFIGSGRKGREAVTVPAAA